MFHLQTTLECILQSQGTNMLSNVFVIAYSLILKRYFNYRTLLLERWKILKYISTIEIVY